MSGILSDLRVLELAHQPSGAFCAKLLADQGADTIKVEPPGWGDQARHEPPFIGDEPHPDRATAFLAFNIIERAAGLGQDNQQVLSQVAGLSDAEIEALARAGVIADIPRPDEPRPTENEDFQRTLLPLAADPLNRCRGCAGARPGPA